jgi:hypothetical protein
MRANVPGASLAFERSTSMDDCREVSALLSRFGVILSRLRIGQFSSGSDSGLLRYFWRHRRTELDGNCLFSEYNGLIRFGTMMDYCREVFAASKVWGRPLPASSWPVFKWVKIRVWFGQLLLLYVVRLNSLYSMDWYRVTATANYRLRSTLSDKTKRLLGDGVVTEAMTTKNRGCPGLGIVEISKYEPGLSKYRPGMTSDKVTNREKYSAEKATSKPTEQTTKRLLFARQGDSRPRDQPNKQTTDQLPKSLLLSNETNRQSSAFLSLVNATSRPTEQTTKRLLLSREAGDSRPTEQ